MYHLLSWGQIKSICLFMYSLDNILRTWWLLNCLITVTVISIQITVSGPRSHSNAHTCEENNPSSLPLSLFAHYSSSFTRPAPLWFIPGQARHASGWWVVTGIKYGNNLRHGECSVLVTMRRILCLGPRSSQPALQTDYPARAHYYLKRGHRIWNFTVKLKSRRSNSLLIHAEKIGKLLYFDQRIWIGHKGLMNLSPGVRVQWKDEMFTWSRELILIIHQRHFPSLTPAWPDPATSQ